MITFIIVTLIVQIPSIYEQGRISFENKGDWNARNWVTHVMRLPAGSFFAYAHPEWHQVDEYIANYGEDSIPQGIIRSIEKDPKFMLDNFTSNVFARFPFILITSIGFLFIPLIDYLRKPEYWLSTKNIIALPLLMVFFSVGLGVSLIVVSFVEHRWQFMAVSSAILLASIQMENYRNIKIQKAINVFQLIFLLGATMISIYSNIYAIVV